MNDNMISVRLGADLKKKLQTLADTKKITLTAFIRIELVKLLKNKFGYDEEKDFNKKQERIKKIADLINNY